jgi:hypothetical protein
MNSFFHAGRTFKKKERKRKNEVRTNKQKKNEANRLIIDVLELD